MEPVSYVTISAVGCSVYFKVLILKRLFARLAAKSSAGWKRFQLWRKTVSPQWRTV